MVAATGLSLTRAGEGLGAEKDAAVPVLKPVLTYRMILPQETDPTAFFPKLKELEEEEPELHAVWHSAAKEIQIEVMIQKEYGFSDRDLIDQIQMNPYYQFFIGLPGYQMTAPFSAPLLVEFRKRLSDEVINEINEMIIEHNKPEPPAGSSSGKNDETAKAEGTDNNGTLIVDATCAPQNISFPQDINLLNEAREDLEEIIGEICYENNLCKPRMAEKAEKWDSELMKDTDEKIAGLRSKMQASIAAQLENQKKAAAQELADIQSSYNKKHEAGRNSRRHRLSRLRNACARHPEPYFRRH